MLLDRNQEGLWQYMVRYIEGQCLSKRTFLLGKISAVMAWCYAWHQRELGSSFLTETEVFGAPR